MFFDENDDQIMSMNRRYKQRCSLGKEGPIGYGDFFCR
jgi:hypothetical protein